MRLRQLAGDAPVRLRFDTAAGAGDAFGAGARWAVLDGLAAEAPAAAAAGFAAELGFLTPENGAAVTTGATVASRTLSASFSCLCFFSAQSQHRWIRAGLKVTRTRTFVRERQCAAKGKRTKRRSHAIVLCACPWLDNRLMNTVMPHHARVPHT